MQSTCVVAAHSARPIRSTAEGNGDLERGLVRFQFVRPLSWTMGRPAPAKPEREIHPTAAGCLVGCEDRCHSTPPRPPKGDYNCVISYDKIAEVIGDGNLADSSIGPLSLNPVPRSEGAKGGLALRSAISYRDASRSAPRDWNEQTVFRRQRACWKDRANSWDFCWVP
ncbi:hypothetical protein GQ53DRAFT_55307 [Thozetella sp. PMI_491]|nr:hypothetical protein GQ53DRAFT_55307 [Thozetella sp. PMI_491]